MIVTEGGAELRIISKSLATRDLIKYGYCTHAHTEISQIKEGVGAELVMRERAVGGMGW